MEEFPSLVVHVTQGEKSCAGSYKGKCTKDDNLRSYKHVKKESLESLILACKWRHLL